MSIYTHLFPLFMIGNNIFYRKYRTITFFFSFHFCCRKIAPTILLDVPDDSTVMQEEIFGPILPILTVSAGKFTIRS